MFTSTEIKRIICHNLQIVMEPDRCNKTRRSSSSLNEEESRKEFIMDIERSEGKTRTKRRERKISKLTER